ncbi:FtsB family cell division protein [Microscilla marina]|uniref:Septum formation initiator subfamily, putative n=1 Tax=Microscilla marina ATCC 23134 TaxID=313606 RepID=A1ZLS4_MICM2|nr:septum formation initiator family protein [Microscilla marina]EAY28828.1 septum formation initiator subfamily, putative [Microscilla marina ATCC 23134]
MHEDEEEELINAPKTNAGKRLGNMLKNRGEVQKKKFKIPKFFRSFYFITGSIFLIWMLFFDINDLYTQYQRREKLKQLQKDKVFYANGIKKIKDERARLSTDPKKLEKFAREKYYMKKKGEDVYVVVEEKDKEETVEAKVLNPKTNATPPPAPIKQDTTQKK